MYDCEVQACMSIYDMVVLRAGCLHVILLLFSVEVKNRL